MSNLSKEEFTNFLQTTKRELTPDMVTYAIMDAFPKELTEADPMLILIAPIIAIEANKILFKEEFEELGCLDE